MATFGGSSYSNPTKMVTFKTSDDEQVKVPVEIARMFGVVRDFYDGDLDRPEVANASKMLPKTNFFGLLSDKTIVDLVKAADYLYIQELLDFVMLSVRKRFSLGDDEGVEFVYMAEAEAILRRRAASARKPTMATYGGSSDPNPTKMVTFKTSDDKQVKVPVEIARMFRAVRGFFEVENADPFPLPNVHSDILVNIVLASKMLPKTNFFGLLSDKTIVDLVKAADYLYIQELLDFVMPSVRKRFSLGDDKGVEFVYTAEAEAILRRRAASARKPTMATFITSDGERFKVPVAIAMMFGIVKAFVDGKLDGPELENTVWPLPNVSSYVLDIVVYACKKPLEFLAKYDAVEKERQKLVVEFIGQQTDETIVEQVKAADYLEIEELLDLVMPSFRKRFGLGDDKGVEFVYTAEAETEAIRLRSAAWASEGASS